MHDCETTKERLVELLFGELGGAAKARALEELGACADCREQYRSMAATLEIFDEAAEGALPAEGFWAGYGERLRKRMAQELSTDMLTGALPFARGEYRLTFLEDEGLTRRLARELRSVARDAELTWPEFKRDPLGFASRSAHVYSNAAWRFFSQRNVALATFSSILFVTLFLGAVFGLERLRASRAAANLAAVREDLQFLGMVDDIPREQSSCRPRSLRGCRASRPSFRRRASWSSSARG